MIGSLMIAKTNTPTGINNTHTNVDRPGRWNSANPVFLIFTLVSQGISQYQNQRSQHGGR